MGPHLKLPDMTRIGNTTNRVAILFTHLAAPRTGEPRNLVANPGPFFRIPAATLVAIFTRETEAAVVLKWKYLATVRRPVPLIRTNLVQSSYSKTEKSFLQ